MQEMVEGVSQEPAEGGDELEPAVREVTEPHGQVLEHLVHPRHTTQLGRAQTEGSHLVQLRKVVPATQWLKETLVDHLLPSPVARLVGGCLQIILPGKLAWLGWRVLC